MVVVYGSYISLYGLTLTSYISSMSNSASSASVSSMSLL